MSKGSLCEDKIFILHKRVWIEVFYIHNLYIDEIPSSESFIVFSCSKCKKWLVSDIAVRKFFIPFVFDASSGRSAITFTPSSVAFRERSEVRASRRSCLFIEREKFRSFRGPNVTPPPRRVGERRSPTREAPVPFCLYIFFVLPAISQRSFV